MSGSKQTGFFKMPLADLLYIAIVLAFAVLAFLPWARDIHFGGVALVGWLMAVLMVVSPVIAIVQIGRERSRDRRDDDTESES